MLLRAIKTRTMQPPQDDLFAVVKESIPSIKERSILVVTSKVVSIWQGRVIKISDIAVKDELVKREAEKYLPREVVPGGFVIHTIKNNLLIPTAGIDESNADGHYVLWPEKVSSAAEEIWHWARKQYGVTDLGILITDSHSIPMRRGVVGISLAHYGFNPLKDYRHTLDLFGREFHFSQTNLADGLASAAAVVMGEGSESTPLVLIEDIPGVEFISAAYVPKDKNSSFEISPAEDLYSPFISNVPWEKGGASV